MKNTRFLFPNALTLLNLLLGCVAIIIVFRGQNEYHAAWFIFIAAVIDFLDGWVAKMLNAKSAFGLQLDSLADVVSFGVAPSVMLFNWFDMILTKLSQEGTYDWVSASFVQNLILLSALLFAGGAAIRLARFNVHGSDKDYFRGLPTPAAALVVASFWLIINTEDTWIGSLIWNVYFVSAVLLLLVILMVSNLKMLSLKFSNFRLKDNLYRYILLLCGILLVAIFRIEGIIYSIVAFILLSLVNNATAKKV